MPPKIANTSVSTAACESGGNGPKPTPVVPDHELIRRIGEGGYGEVWLARSALGTYRAVKVVYRLSFKEEGVYEREFRGIQKFEPISRSNDGLLDILQAGRNDAAGYYYYVMELADDSNAECRVRNAESTTNHRESIPQSAIRNPSLYAPKTLRGEIQLRHRLPPAECVQLALNLTLALSHLHRHGLIHRDIKPANIIFVQDIPKLADIGLVTTFDETCSFAGTEGYIAPEGPTSPRSDLFSLGKVLYEISTGKDRKDFPEPATGLGEQDDQALEELNAVILKACALDPRERYQSAEEFHADLALLQRGKSVKWKRVVERRLDWAKKAISVVALIVLVGSAGYLARKATRPGYVTPHRLAVNNAEFWRVPSYPRQFDFAQAGEFLRMVFAGEKGLSVWDEKTGINRPWNLRGHEGWQADSGAKPRWSPDGQHFIFQAFKKMDSPDAQPLYVHSFFLASAGTGESRRLGPELPNQDRPRDFAWLPDGKAVTYQSWDGRFYTLNLATGARSLWVDATLPPLRYPQLGDYSPDGNWLPISIEPGGADTSREERDIWLIPHGGGRAVQLTDAPGLDSYPTWAPDGETVYYVSGGGRRLSRTWGIWKVRIDPRTGLSTGPRVEVFSKKGQQLLYPRFLNRGRKLAFAGAEPNTRIWAAADPTERGSEVIRGQSPVLSPDGATVYFIGETPEQQGVFALGRDGNGDPRNVCDLVPLGEPFPRSGLSLSPDGALIAMFSFDAKTKKLGVFTIPTAGGSPRLIEELTEWDLIVPVWSPDGQWLAYVSDKVLYRISRDGAVREPLSTLYRWQGDSVRWSPDGKWLAALAYDTPEHWEEKNGVFAVSIAGKTWRKLTPESEDQYKEGLDWHPDGQRLTYFFYGPEDGNAKIKWAFLNEPGKTEEMIDQEEHWDYVGVWAPDGQRFFFHSAHLKTYEKGIHVYNAATRNITPRLRDRDGWLPEWSRDGHAAVWTTSETSRYFEVLEDFR